MSVYGHSGMAEPLEDLRDYARKVPDVEVIRTTQSDTEYTAEIDFGPGGEGRTYAVDAMREYLGVNGWDIETQAAGAQLQWTATKERDAQ